MKSKVSILEPAMKDIVDKSYNILKALNEHIKILLDKLENPSKDKAFIQVIDDKDSPNDSQVGHGRRTRSYWI